MKLLAVLPEILLCACLPPKPVAFVDPAGGPTVQCASKNAGSFLPLIPSIVEREQGEIDRCVASYERLGWRRE